MINFGSGLWCHVNKNIGKYDHIRISRQSQALTTSPGVCVNSEIYIFHRYLALILGETMHDCVAPPLRHTPCRCMLPILRIPPELPKFTKPDRRPACTRTFRGRRSPCVKHIRCRLLYDLRRAVSITRSLSSPATYERVSSCASSTVEMGALEAMRSTLHAPQRKFGIVRRGGTGRLWSWFIQSQSCSFMMSSTLERARPCLRMPSLLERPELG
jgi:hypothetical protein